MKPFALLLSALCGAIIAIALGPRRYLRIETRAEWMPTNQMEICSMRNAIDHLRERLGERDLQLKRRVELLGPSERKN